MNLLKWNKGDATFALQLNWFEGVAGEGDGSVLVL